VYENASGQLLNLAKTVRIPLGLPEQLPDWLKDTGCYLSKPGEIQRYLSGPWGVGLTKYRCTPSASTASVSASNPGQRKCSLSRAESYW
jgi:hypothetical protein